ncbi:MAG: glycosyltransferase family 2 protein [Desulfotomaculaceae bacterium]
MTPQQQRPLLSICIPTFNRALLLKEAVESILAQAEAVNTADLEIVISDNASSDETAKVVADLSLSAKVPIQYFKNESNFGFDVNCLKVVERASGEYAWILGDDDLLAAGALQRVTREIGAIPQADLFYGEKEDFLLTPDRPMRYRRIMPFPGVTIFDFKRQRTIEEYFRTNKKLIAYFNYLSNIIFKRESWLRTENKEAYLGSKYIHVYIFQKMLWGAAPGLLAYLPFPVVKRRWGNDSFVGPAERLMVDVTMYHRIAAGVFTDQKYVRMIDELVIRNDGYSWAVRAKINDPQRFNRVIWPFLVRYYWSQPLFWLKIAPLIFLPTLLLRFGRGLYRKTVKGEPLNIKAMLEG